MLEFVGEDSFHWTCFSEFIDCSLPDRRLICFLSMTLHSKSDCGTYYDVLHVKEDASYEEIRQAYKLALLQSHPDKLHNSSNIPNSDNNVGDRFMKVQNAWETLSDPMSRALYDNKLQSLRSDVLVADDVALENMIVEDTGEALEFYHQCRCGDCFLISGTELEEMGYELCRDEDEILIRTPEALPGSVILPCGSCSLRIQLSINLNTSVLVDGDSVKL